MSLLLVIGATGTLGRQIVRSALKEGYKVRCLVRNFNNTAFLQEWGANTIWGNLCQPDSLYPALTGVRAVIDAATTRPADYSGLNVYQLDFIAKKNLIEAAKAMKIEKFIFFSILYAEKYPEVPLMRIKSSTELLLKESGLNFTIFKLCGFFQGLIKQYAIPILDQQVVWVAGELTPIAYFDTRDIAKFTMKALLISNKNKQTFALVGKQAWNSSDIIRLCERLSGQKAKINRIPLSFLLLTKKTSRFFEWSWNVADRLAFTEILVNGKPFTTNINETYKTFELEETSTTYLENYLQEYFACILKILKQIKKTNNV
uniref:NmrA-like domain-containing protein n=1 Tax=Cyanoptyche gloeocystis TaxID=77922 RepID=A0A3G1IWI9_9EUKA|nr:hypothetical protein [Cyanoptyche gloeocystis]|mmetsp:Transcript_27606/g.47666  ORF Transcript_27606/g.47666 Transcript_27606/m.47666 type:complete len:316 (+) Transcript_27606:51-998(+)